ncbi:DUF3168 domain-containing protein [Paracoccus sp. MBLB3053]|uniref:DUF3168 domain-containing protein n=1 Tax=Paracoccus aurantius TaxID=3073814 RepID=A0ABU2HLV9_9RHOB|nr:DUF3168 domain-containing protein [Paracoccus sp. MBLB3053]MDS9466019.1 DUF3168 domain-containing protein [Paracoccus sp. MBLB3053]
MSYQAALALQTSIYQALIANDALRDLVGDRIYDASPAVPPAGVHVAIGPEDTRDAGDMTGRGSVHELRISVHSGADEPGGFREAKAVAAQVTTALESASFALATGHLVGIWFVRAKAQRIGNGDGRRVDLIFRARIDLG